MPRDLSNRRRRAARVVVCASIATIAWAHPSPAKVKQASWLAATSGTWDEGSYWSSSPNYPHNGTPAATGYTVSISAAGSAYTVILDTSVTIDSLTLNSAAATLFHSAGTLSLPTFNLSSGTYQLNGGVLQHAAVTGAGAFLVNSGALDDVTLGSNLTVAGLPSPTASGGLDVYNGLTLTNNASIFLGTSDITFWNGGSLAGSGTLTFTGAGSGPTGGIYATSGSPLTIAAGIRIQTGGGSGIVSANSSGSIVSYGTLSSNTAGKTLQVFGPVTNFGTFEANNGGTLTVSDVDNGGTINVTNSTLNLYGNWSSSGPINLANSTSELAGTFNTASLRNVHLTGGTLALTGTLDNTADTFVADSLTGAWPFRDSTQGFSSIPGIRGGTLTSTNPGNALLIPVGGSAGTFDSVSINASLISRVPVTLRGQVSIGANLGLRLDNSAGSGSTAQLILDPTARLVGPGSVYLDNGPGLIYAPGGGTLAGAIRSGSGAGFYTHQITGPSDTSPSTGTLSLENYVTTTDPGHTIRITGRWANTGILEAFNGGTLSLGGTTNNVGILRSSLGGKIVLAGLDYDNTGKTFTVDGATGNPTLTTSGSGTLERVTTFHGGSILTGVNSALLVGRGSTNDVPGARFDNVIVGGTVSVLAEGELRTTNGLTFNNFGRISLNGAAAQANMTALFSEGDQTFSGTGEIVFDGNSFHSWVAPKTGTLTIGPGITIRSGSRGGAVGNSDAGTYMVNQGTIAARGANNNITVWGNWDNTLGTFEADGAYLYLSGIHTTAQLGTLRALNNGNISFGGILDNTGATLSLSNPTGGWLQIYGNVLDSSLITGGTIAGNGRIGLDDVVLDGVTLAGLNYVAGNIYGSNTVAIQNNLTLSGTLLMDPAKVLSFSGNQSLIGTGTIAPANTSTAPTVAATNLTIGPGITLRAGTSNGFYSGLSVTAAGSLTNQGLLSADQPQGNLNVTAAGAITNTGTIQAVNGGSVQLYLPTAAPGGLTNTGTLRVAAGSSLRLHGYYSSDSLGHIENAGSLSVEGTLANPGTFTIDDSLGSFSVAGEIRGGTLAVTGAGSLNLVNTVTAYGLTLAANPSLAPGSNLTVRDGISVAAGSALSLAGGSVTVVPSPAPLNGYDLSGPGEILITSAASTLSSATSFTTSPNLTIRNPNSAGTISNMVNSGTIVAQNPAATLIVQGGWSNSGLMKATTGGTLQLLGVWSNTGTLAVDPNSTLVLGGIVNTPGLGNVQLNGGTLNLIGQIDNTNQTLSFTSGTGNIVLGNPNFAPRITGGTITTANDLFLDVAYLSVLDNVRLNGEASVRPGATLQLISPPSSTSPARIMLNNSTLDVVNTLSGPAEIVLDGNPASTPDVLIATSGTLNIGPAVTVRTGTNDGRISQDKPFTNNGILLADLPGGNLEVFRPTNSGTIRATAGSTATVSNFTNVAGGLLSADNGGTLNLSGTWSNAGTISLTDSTLQFSSPPPASLGSLTAVNSIFQIATPFTAAQVAPFLPGGNSVSVTFGGSIDNTGNTLDLADTTLRLLPGGTLKGGTFTSTAPNPPGILAGAGSVTTATIDVPFSLSPVIPKGTTTFLATDTTFTRPATFIGNGTGTTTPNTRITFAGAWGNTSSMSVENASLILPATGANTGDLTLTDVALNFASFDNLGTVTRTGGSATFTGTLTNTGSTFDPNLTPIGSVYLGSNARITGGTLASATPVTVVGGGQLPTFLDGVTLAADLSLPYNSGKPGGVNEPVPGSITSLNGLTFTGGSQVFLSPRAFLRSSGDQSFSGTGSVLLGGGTIAVTGNLTLGPNITVRSDVINGTASSSLSGTISIANTVSGGTLTSFATITADTPGRTLRITGSTFSNQGTLIATGGSTLQISSVLANLSSGTLTGGTYSVSDNSLLAVSGIITTNAATIVLSGPAANLYPLVLADNAGSLTLTSGKTLGVFSFTNTGSVTLGPDAALQITGGLSNSGTITLTGGSVLLAYSTTSPIDDLRQQLLTGHLTTTLPDTAIAYVEASLLGLTTYGGFPVDSTTLITRLTLPGDANLDGQVNADDYVLLDRSMAIAPSNPHWTDGDFNYDGAISSADYLVIDTALGRQQGGQLSPAFVSARESQFGATYVSSLLAAVPEPGGSLPLICVGAAIARRRRRRG